MRLRTFLWLCVFSITLGGVGLFLGLRSYRVFTQEELVAVVQCGTSPKKEAEGAFLVEVTQVTRGIPGRPEKFSMRGDQWTIGGEILKWHPWLNFVGMRNCHKLTRVGSRYLQARQEMENPRWAYDLNGGTDLLWEWLYRFGRRIPLVEAVYGNATYQLAQPGSRWGVYVTLSGYLAKPLANLPVSKKP